jgi:hypothetical protein
MADRVNQTVVRKHLEREVGTVVPPRLCCGYRAWRSALDAVGMCLKRFWKYDWVTDLDLRAFYVSGNFEGIMKYVNGYLFPE